MKMKVKITHYTKSNIGSIQYGNDPSSFNYELDDNAKGFSLEIIRLIKQGASIEVETLEFI
jgi:hypothetical protein